MSDCRAKAAALSLLSLGCSARASLPWELLVQDLLPALSLEMRLQRASG